MSAKKTKHTRAPAADPPFVHHTQAQQISPAEAQKSIAKFLTKSRSNPYMHPDSFLHKSGIRFAIGSGPSGGVALHHIRRIEAGLRGEYHEKETPEQLEALFGDRWRDAGDDHVLDGMIDKSEQKLWKKRKREEEIEEWATSSQPDVDDLNDQYRGYAYHHHEIESFANTPVHQPTYGSYADDEGEQWQDPYEYELQQKVWTRDPQSGEQGGSAGTMVAQGGEVPQLTLHDGEGNVASEPKKNKEERKAAKKARKEADKLERIRAAQQEKIREREDAERKVEKKVSKEEKRKKQKWRDDVAQRGPDTLLKKSGPNGDDEQDSRMTVKDDSDEAASIKEEPGDEEKKKRREEKRRRKQEKREKKAKREKD